MSKLLHNFSIKISHENVVTVVQWPNVFIAILASVWHRWAGIRAQMRGCIYNMFTVFCNERTRTPALAGADHFVFEFIASLFRHLSIKDLVAFQTFFRVGPLENDVFPIKAPISFCIVTSKS